MAEEVSLSGTVESVVFHSEDTGFCVFRARLGQGQIETVVGTHPSIYPGELFEATGDWRIEPQFGRQFKSNELSIHPPCTEKGIEKYLSSGIVKGIGSHFAKTLVKAFGEDVFLVIDNQPERLLDLPGIGKKRYESFIKSWKEQTKIREIMVFLHSFGFGSMRAAKIYRRYGDNSISLIRENPYRLCEDIRGIGFSSADAIALSLGIEKDSPQRVAAALEHTLNGYSRSGHCYAERQELISKTSALLEVSTELVDVVLSSSCEQEKVLLDNVSGEDAISLPYLYFSEIGFAKRISSLLNQAADARFADLDFDSTLPWLEQRNELSFSNGQKAAIRLALTHKCSIITGGPGVGKTTVLKSIVELVKLNKGKLLLLAPTGRAAKRLSESAGLEAKTIHRALEMDPATGGFKRDETFPLEADFIVVDEVSMMDIMLANRLFKAIPEQASVVLVGDRDQLPSVGPGNVLSDLIQSQMIPSVELKEIFRQSKGSRIVKVAHLINKGENPPLSSPRDGSLTDFYFVPVSGADDCYEKLLEMIQVRIPKRFHLNGREDIQVLSPMNRGALGVECLNEKLQLQLNRGEKTGIKSFHQEFRPGDKVIQIVNNYDKEVFNGDIGWVCDYDAELKELSVQFDNRTLTYEESDLDELRLAYAVTIHKSQGSEFPCVILILSMEHYRLLERNLIYTGVTRGRKLVILMGSERAVKKAVSEQRVVERKTHLKERLISASLEQKDEEYGFHS